MKNITHIITGLSGGGAEAMLYKLLVNIDRGKYDISVISMTDMGVFGSKITDLGLKVYTLNMKRGMPSPAAILRTLKLCHDADVIQTWMYHANMLGTVIKFFRPGIRLILGIRQSTLSPDKDKRSTILIAKLNAILSGLSYAVICNARAGIVFHSDFGYHRNKMAYIPNGMDLDDFQKIDSTNVLEQESYIQSGYQGKVICSVGRWDIQKGYAYLLEAISILKEKRIEIKLTLCGKGMEAGNAELASLLRTHDIEDEVILLGRREDISHVLSASDVFVSSSIGEGFSNAIGEAMACELVCVITDVGDSAEIVGDAGFIAKPHDSQDLAKALEKAIRLEKSAANEMGKKARERIKENYDIKKVIQLFEALYE